MPGSPFNDEKLNAEQKALLYAKYGLDQPVVLQFFKYTLSALRGDFDVGYDISENILIAQLIVQRLPISIRIDGMAVAIRALVGLLLKLVAALNRDTTRDSLATATSVIDISVPSYAFALVLSLQLRFKPHWFPMLYSTKEVLSASVLSSTTLSMSTLTPTTRFIRLEMVEVLDGEYILLAESKGLSRRALLFRHVPRNALIPTIMVLVLLIVNLMTGSLVVGKIFAIPDVGSLFVSIIQSNGYNVVISLSFIYSVACIAIMSVVGILYGTTDPRIRLVKERG